MMNYWWKRYGMPFVMTFKHHPFRSARRMTRTLLMHRTRDSPLNDEDDLRVKARAPASSSIAGGAPQYIAVLISSSTIDSSCTGHRKSSLLWQNSIELSVIHFSECCSMKGSWTRRNGKLTTIRWPTEFYFPCSDYCPALMTCLSTLLQTRDDDRDPRMKVRRRLSIIRLNKWRNDIVFQAILSNVFSR